MRSGGKTGEESRGRTILQNMVDAELCNKFIGPSSKMTKHWDRLSYLFYKINFLRFTNCLYLYAI